MAQPVFDNSNSVQGTAVSSLTIPAFLVGGNNRLLFVGVGASGAAPTSVSTVVRGGTESFIEKWDVNPTGSFCTAGFYFVAPATGSQSIVVTMNATHDELCAGAQSWTEVNQTDPVGTHATNSGTGGGAAGSSTVTCSATDDQVIVDMSYLWDSPITVGADQTSRWKQEGIGGATSGGSSHQSGAISGDVMTWSGSALNTWVAGAMPINGISIPQYQATGSVVASDTGNVTVNWPTHLANDIGVLVVETADEAVSLVTAAGFEQLPSVSPQSGGAPLLINRTRLTAFWCRATSASMTSPVVANPGNHVVAYIMTFRGVAPTGNPWNVMAGDNVSGTGVTSIDVPGGTTTVGSCLIVLMVAYKFVAAGVSGWTNSDLANLTQRADLGTSLGNEGSVAIATGEKLSAGTFGTTTATLSSTSQQGRIMMALRSSGDSALPPTAPADIFLYVGEA